MISTECVGLETMRAGIPCQLNLSWGGKKMDGLRLQNPYCSFGAHLTAHVQKGAAPTALENTAFWQILPEVSPSTTVL